MSDSTAEIKLNGNQVAILTLLWAVVAPVGIVVRGAVMHACWGWFVEPLGAPPVSIIHCYGLSVCVNLVAGSTFSDPKKDFWGMIVLISTMPIRNLWIWGLAYVIHCWM